MYRPQHGILSANAPMSPQRMAGIGFAILLNVAAVWALMSGLAMKIVNMAPPDLIASVIVSTPDKPAIAPPKPAMVVPKTTEAIVPPEINIASNPPQTAIAVPPATPAPPSQAVPDGGPSAIGSTHTTPPYPALARKMSEQGTARLHLTIAADGSVTNAQLVASSGFADLDQTAIAWVVAHWRYKPAVQNGVAVPSTAEAAVRFNLKESR